MFKTVEINLKNIGKKNGKIIWCFNCVYGLIFDSENQNLKATFFTFFISMFSTIY